MFEDKKKFKELFITQFLANWCSNIYKYSIETGNGDIFKDAPIEDADCIAEDVWGSLVDE